jgi:hypothetical protein
MILGEDHSPRRVAAELERRSRTSLAGGSATDEMLRGPLLGVRPDRSYQETTRGLGTDRRTVKEKADSAFLTQLAAAQRLLAMIAKTMADGGGANRQ